MAEDAWVIEARKAAQEFQDGVSYLLDFAIIRLEMRGGPTEHDFEYVRKMGARLAYCGDEFEFKDGRNPDKPPSMADIAKALACAAWLPDGLEFNGQTYKRGGSK